MLCCQLVLLDKDKVRTRAIVAYGRCQWGMMLVKVKRSEDEILKGWAGGGEVARLADEVMEL